jgi:hypothetical protein
MAMVMRAVGDKEVEGSKRMAAGEGDKGGRQAMATGMKRAMAMVANHEDNNNDD